MTVMPFIVKEDDTNYWRLESPDGSIIELKEGMILYIEEIRDPLPKPAPDDEVSRDENAEMP